ncbi:efflux RND transporter periplasmic adaptor subunit [Chondrinema litorale]|uniref:efflux RND transporter periplasmic adaptor subunit n=1 Tax=Chondrinema litorale TaxID=2994555 RepID=UPI002543F0BA|nr:efflux RND transporter periplasmic adaptor subunit [Chondrinema litorale]UZR92580.1 efflux RND transporter periplasmic adaptor subunit [Chondrinema litorale]
MKLNTKTISIGLIVIIVATLVIAKMDFSQAEDGQSVTTSGKENKGIFVRAMEISKETIEERLVSKGSIIPNEEVMITSESSGKVTSISFNEGDIVKKGQLLVTLDDRELVSELEKYKHERDFLEKKSEREKKLNERGGISDEQYEETIRDLQTTISEIDLINTQIDKKKIRAPFSGKIGLRYISEGSYITPSDVIAGLVDASTIKIDFTLPEKYMAKIKTGTDIHFSVDGTDEDFSGKIYAIEPKIDVSTRTISLRAKAQNTNGRILPGAFANITIILNRIENTLCVPTEAIIPEMNTKRVFLSRNGKAESVEVETGLRLPEKIQIVNGLNEGDSVVISGILQIRNGSSLNVLPE